MHSTILPAKYIRDMPAEWSVCLLYGLLCCQLLRVLCGLVRWSYAVVFALLLFQVSKCVSWCGSGGGSSRARHYLQVRRAKRGSPAATASSGRGGYNSSEDILITPSTSVPTYLSIKRCGEGVREGTQGCRLCLEAAPPVLGRFLILLTLSYEKLEETGKDE